MRKLKKSYGKALCVLAISTLILGSTTGFATPQSIFGGHITPGIENQEEDTEEDVDKDLIPGKDTDVVLSKVNAPSAKYGTGTNIGFTATVKGTGAYITSIAPVVSADFPFETNDAAYKIVTPNGTEKPSELNASYNFTVRGDVSTGYHAVQFQIEYNKDGKDYSLVKTINVKLEGEPATTEEPATEAPAETGPISTPRVIVTGYETNPAKVNAGDNFTLTIHLKNTSGRTAVSNMKVALEAANGEFLPTSGSSTQFISKITSGSTEDIVIEMNAQASLEPKPYVLNVTCDYEDSSANPFQSVEHISIPVYQEARIKLTEFMVSPDMISVGDQGSVSFSINNLGKSTLANVQARIEGSTVESEETFVGNIAAGATGYADVMVTGVAPTEDEGTVKLILTYEDSSGAECTYEEDITVFVIEQSFDVDEGVYDEGYVDDVPKGNPVIKKIIIGVAVFAVVIIAAVVVVIILVNRNKKKKAQAEADELENEIDEDALFVEKEK